MTYTDPLNGATLTVRSICMPSRTLLQGKVYSQEFILSGLKPVKRKTKRKTKGGK